MTMTSQMRITTQMKIVMPLTKRKQRHVKPFGTKKRTSNLRTMSPKRKKRRKRLTKLTKRKRKARTSLARLHQLQSRLLPRRAISLTMNQVWMPLNF